MSLLQATLTLPGMAGILLTLGMAVDANILINERIREEQRNGRPPLAALEHGFKRAYSTIFDSNATAFLAHVMLFVFGSGPVQRLRRDHHRRHRHVAVHRLDADAAAGVPLVCRNAAPAAAGLRTAMFIRPRFRLVPDGTRIQFMRGRFMGLIVSAMLSTASVVLFFYPGPESGHRFLRRHRDGGADPGPGRLRANPRGAGAPSTSPTQGVQRFGDASTRC